MKQLTDLEHDRLVRIERTAEQLCRRYPTVSLDPLRKALACAICQNEPCSCDREYEDSVGA